MVMVTTRGLVTVTVSMVVMAGPVRADALWAAKLAATAAASHGGLAVAGVARGRGDAGPGYRAGIAPVLPGRAHTGWSIAGPPGGTVRSRPGSAERIGDGRSGAEPDYGGPDRAGHDSESRLSRGGGRIVEVLHAGLGAARPHGPGRPCVGDVRTHEPVHLLVGGVPVRLDGGLAALHQGSLQGRVVVTGHVDGEPGFDGGRAPEDVVQIGVDGAELPPHRGIE